MKTNYPKSNDTYGWLKIFPEARAIVKQQIKNVEASITKTANKIQAMVRKYAIKKDTLEADILKMSVPADELRELEKVRDKLIYAYQYTGPKSTEKQLQWIKKYQAAKQMDLEFLAQNSGVELRPYAGKLVGKCPFHDEKTPSFVIYPDDKGFHCFGCQANGDVITFFMKINDCDFKTAVEKLGV